MELTDLKAGQRIKVIQEFADFDGDVIPLNSQWTFKQYHYFPYDGGYTFDFNEGIIRLAEIDDANRQVLSQFNTYFTLID